jgi:hypothetical protein
MARPNGGKTSKRVCIKVHPSMVKLLNARRIVLDEKGQRFVKIASMYDISEEFVDHYWNLISNTAAENGMRRAYSKVTASSKNI